MVAPASSPSAAGILPRLGAWLVDLALAALAVQALHWSVFLATGGPLALLDSGWKWYLFLLATVSAPVAIAFAACESSKRRSTPGKRLFGLEVADVYGARIGFARALARNASKLVPWELTHLALCLAPSPLLGESWSRQATLGIVLSYVLLGLDLGAAMMTRRQQSVHDLIAGSYVVRSAPRGSRVRRESSV